MNGAVDAMQALGGGLGAVLTPGLALSVVAVATAGLTLGRVLRRRDLALVVAVFVVVFTAATVRRGVGADGVFSISVGLIALATCRLVVGNDPTAAWRAAAAGLPVAVVAVLWRVESFGPVLAELRGPWQSDPATGLLAVYHLGTALALSVAFWIAGEVGRILPARVASPVTGGIVVALALATLLGFWPVLVETFMLRWPHVPLG